jgi:hypothetical protein
MFDETGSLGDSWQPVLEGQRRHSFRVLCQHVGVLHEYGLGPIFDESGERSLEVIRCVHAHVLHPDPQLACRFVERPERYLWNGMEIKEVRDP